MKCIDLIHFWEFPVGIRIKLDKKYRKKFFSNAVNYFGTSRKVSNFLIEKSKKYYIPYRNYGSIIRHYKSNSKYENRQFIPIWIVMELGKILKYDKYEIERKIISYRSYGGAIIVDPILPIKVSPEFDSIVSHMTCDGTDKRTRTGASSYTQYSLKGREQFYRKLTNVFGEIKPSPFYENRKDMSVGVPKPIMMIIKHHYKIKSFGCRQVRIPEQILSNPFENRLGYLIAFIIDEGSVYDIMALRTTNIGLMKDLRILTKSLGYDCSKVTNKKHKNYNLYGFNISNFSLKKMANDIEYLEMILNI